MRSLLSTVKASWLQLGCLEEQALEIQGTRASKCVRLTERRKAGLCVHKSLPSFLGVRSVCSFRFGELVPWLGTQVGMTRWPALQPTCGKRLTGATFPTRFRLN